MKIRTNSVSGVALIIVLGFLVIISALAVAFFSSVNTELKASRNFAAGITTRQLSDSAVQIVMGQIASATTRGIDSLGVGHEAWASQPGMIRVYGKNNGGNYVESSEADAFFKLYSSDKMVVTGTDLATFNPSTDFLNAWDKSPAYWTDLNAPVIIRDTTGAASPRFPIIDPRAQQTTINPAAPVWGNNVEGFYYDTNGGVNGIVGPGDPNAQRLPMPVRWIYVLQDGTLTTPDTGGTGTTASFTNAPAGKQPTVQNPIVGRVAFWTDDETCKLNLNTAAGYNDDPSKLANSVPNYTQYQAKPSSFAGSYWDTPRFYTEFDYGIPNATGTPASGKASGGLALCQLLQNEFQRYPGHPATTSLAPVLKNLLNSEQIYAVVPRYSNLNLQSQAASTKGGTDRVIVDTTTPGDLDAKQLQPKQDRLYATPDEFMFGAHVKGIPSTSPSYARVTNNFYANLPGAPAGPITPQVIDGLRFFLTTQGRSPELNLFGQPRVTCWPVRAETATETTGMNVFDNLILFCSTVGASTSTGARPDTKSDQSASGVYRYIFVRREVASGGLQQFTRTDFLGNAQKQYEFNSGYTPDWKYGRNTTLLQNYLYGTPVLPGLTSRAIPGNGYKFSGKYADSDRQGILTEIFDYIRLANSQDTTTSLAPPAKAIKFAPLGYVPPSQPSFFTSAGIQAKGFGRMSTLCEATLDFYYAGPQMNKNPAYVPKYWDTNTKTVKDVPGAPANNVTTDPSWSRWDPLAPNARYVKTEYDYYMVDDGTGVPHDSAHYNGDTNGTQRQIDLKKPHANYMRAFLVFSTFDPMQGYAPKADPAATDPKLSIECQWTTDFQVNVTGNNQNLGFPIGGPVFTTVYRAPGSTWGGRNVGGYEGFMHTLHGMATAVDAGRPCKTMWAPNSPLTANDFGTTWVPTNNGTTATLAATGTLIKVPFTATLTQTNQEYYPFQTDIQKAILVPATGTVFSFTGANVRVKLFYGGSTSNSASPALQTFTLSFPSSSQPWPLPKGGPVQLNDAVGWSGSPATSASMTPPTVDVSSWLSIPSTDVKNFGEAPNGVNQAGNTGTLGMRHFYWTGTGAFFSNMATGVRVPMANGYEGAKFFKTSLQASWAFATRLAWVDASDGNSWDPYLNTSNQPIHYWGDRWRCIVQPGDTVRSLLYWDAKEAKSGNTLSGPGPISGGDLRIAALSPTVPPQEFMPHPDYQKPYSRACVMRGADGNLYFPAGAITNLVGSSGAKQGGTTAVALPFPADASIQSSLGNHIFLGNNGQKMQVTRAFANLPWGAGTNISVTQGVNGVMRREPSGKGKEWGDFDTGIGDFPDGPCCNKQDEGNVIFRYFDTPSNQYIYPIPYFTSTWSYQKPGDTFTSPSRQMPSPAMFGSLPSTPTNGSLGGGLGWTTLAFSPNTAGPDHPGNRLEPKDHYLLDLFQMPVVEPYPISEPFSTAGKVNLNYRIAPFDYIRRSTAFRGALYPLRITAVNSQYTTGGNSANYITYKTGFPAGTPLTQNFRLRVDRDETLKAFDGFYDSGLTDPNKGFFKSPTEICERFFYSKDSNPMTYAGSPEAEATTMKAWWANFGDLTGDNEREKPYVDLYPRITTKSNTYTVHVKVQTLRQTPGHPTQWIEGKDAVLGEYRGSATIERYIDPADPRFNPSNTPSFNPDQKSLEPLYRFRTVYTKKFTP